MNIVERRRAQDGQIETTIDGRAARHPRRPRRRSSSARRPCSGCSTRAARSTSSSDLGMPTETHEIFSELVRSPFGMVICAGPTGSGKTTTLYATLAEINTTERNVMTIEDPVEYVLPTVNQIQINEAADVTFAGGLKSILRQDPDVILVGEIRDVETARIAVQSALTGHFVLSSLHATDAASALHRFLDMGIEPFLIAPSVLAVVGQRLVRRICSECRTPYEPPPTRSRSTSEIGGTPKDDVLPRRGLQLLLGHRLPGAHRRLRGAPHDRRDARSSSSRSRSHSADPRARDRGGHASPARRGAAPRRRRHHDDSGDPPQRVPALGQERAGAMAKYKYAGSHRRGGSGQGRGRGRPPQRRARRARGAGALRARASRSGRASGRWSSRRRRCKRAEIMNFSRQLAAFVRAGIPIIDAIDTLRAEVTNDRFREVLAEVSRGAARRARRSRTRSPRTPTSSRPSTSRSCGRPS